MKYCDLLTRNRFRKVLGFVQTLYSCSFRYNKQQIL